MWRLARLCLGSIDRGTLGPILGVEESSAELGSVDRGTLGALHNVETSLAKLGAVERGTLGSVQLCSAEL